MNMMRARNKQFGLRTVRRLHNIDLVNIYLLKAGSYKIYLVSLSVSTEQE